MAIRTMAGVIWTATAAAVVMEQDGATRDGPAPPPDAGYRPPRKSADATRPAPSARPWPFHVLRDTAQRSDSVPSEVDLPCSR